MIEVNIHPAGVLARSDHDHHHPVRGGAPGAPRHREIHARRPAHRHRRRQPRHAGRRDAGRQPAAAPPRPAAKPDRLLAEPPGAVVPVLRNVHRPDQPGAARRRGARRPPLRTRHRFPATRAQNARRRRGDATLAHRPAAAPPAHRPHRQHAPRRVLDRQALFARRPDRPAGPARIPRLRDAAARAHERGADAAAARARRALLAAAVSRQAGALGHRAARPLAVAAFRRRRPARRRRRSQRLRLSVRRGVVRSVRRIPLSALRHRELRRRDHRAAPGDRALARAGRADQRRGHRTLRRFVGRAPAGQGRAAWSPAGTR